MKLFKLKAKHAAFLFACGFFLLSGYEAWNHYAGYREEQATETLLQNAPGNRNSKAVQKVLDRLQGKKSFRFYVIGDTQGSFSTFNKILQRAAAEKPDFIIHAADITTGGRYRQYMKMVDFIEPLAIPVIFGIGNHDCSRRGREIFAHLFGPLDFYFDTGSCRFIFLDCNYEKINPDFIELPQEPAQYDYLHGFDPDQISILETLIKKDGYNFIIVHMPPALDSFKHHSFNRNSRLFTDLMKKYARQIAAVFSGHIHGYGEAVSDGVPYVVSGGAGSRLHQARSGIASRLNYIVVTVDGAAITRRVEFLD